ncbi:hypothetical protein [Chelativorans alearense]|uniref:hypothetical protein n=1 Tax=Chelativorans alearense TaxID=2681495 RepID=UPI0013D6FE02|nr:hypothetical protein [Chelativorans alearense]
MRHSGGDACGAELFGRVSEGSFEAAAAGHLKVVAADMERRRALLAARRSDAGGLVGISWNDIPGGFGYLVDAIGILRLFCIRSGLAGAASYGAVCPLDQFIVSWNR